MKENQNIYDVETLTVRGELVHSRVMRKDGGPIDLEHLKQEASSENITLEIGYLSPDKKVAFIKQRFHLGEL